MRVALYVHGRARGHASRAVAVARALVAAGHSVAGRAGGAALDALRDEAGLTDLEDRAPIVPGPLGWAELVRRVPAEARALRGVDVVVSDGEQPSLLASRAAGVPSVSVGHDLVLTSCALPDGLPRAALLRERANTAVSTYASRARIAVHFLPVQPAREATWVARVDVPEVELRDDGPFVAYLSAWDDSRAHVVAAARAAGVELQCFGGGARAAFLAALARAPGVIATSGSNVLAECVTLRKPVLALYDERHDEQTLNALLLARTAVGVSRRLDALTARDVRLFVTRVARSDFVTVDLRAALRPLSEVILEAVRSLE